MIGPLTFRYGLTIDPGRSCNDYPVTMTKMAEVKAVDANGQIAFGTANAFADHARSRLVRFTANASDYLVRGDFDLNPDVPRPTTTMPAAVLVPIIARAQPTVLLTVRSASLKTHAGQVAFPGGRVEATDDGPVAAALREAEEEVGLHPDLVDPLGLLDFYVTVTGYAITPVVALIDPCFAPRLQASEVATVFEVPLAHVINPANHKLHIGVWQGKPRQTYSIAWQPHYIWGATAGMLKNLSEKLSTP